MASAAMAPVMTGIQKAAILLIALGDQASAEILKHLGDDEVQRVSAAIATLPPISPEHAEAVLEEFHESTSGALHVGQGGVDFAKRMLTAAFGVEGSKRHLDRLPRPAESTMSVNQQLQRFDPQLLARLVKSEHPQTVALILSHLSPAQSATVLGQMDSKARADLAVRIARLDQISPAVIEKISGVIGKKLSSVGEIKRESSGGPRAVAEIFNQLEGALSDEILNEIGEQHAELVEEIRQKMFVFDDLLTLDAAGVKEVLSRADRRQLTIALKGTTDELRKHLLQGMSQRGASMLLEDMDALGPTKIRDVEAAQQQIITVVRQLETEGLVSRNKGGGANEQYV
jgi:flagellar motor switch protein FliG